MLKAIVFDFDGVIVDSEPLHYRAFLCVAETMGVTFDYDYYLKRLIGYDDRDGAKIILARADGAGENAGPEAYRGDSQRITAFKDEKGKMFQQIVSEGIEGIPGAAALMEGAAARLPIAICSGATRADIDLILRGLKLKARFATIVTADDVARSKPDPASYALAVQRLAERDRDRNLTAGDCLAIEDTAAGIESARGAGLWTLGLASSGPASALTRAHRVVETLEGLSIEQLCEWYG